MVEHCSAYFLDTIILMAVLMCYGCRPASLAAIRYEDIDISLNVAGELVLVMYYDAEFHKNGSTLGGRGIPTSAVIDPQHDHTWDQMLAGTKSYRMFVQKGTNEILSLIQLLLARAKLNGQLTHDVDHAWRGDQEKKLVNWQRPNDLVFTVATDELGNKFDQGNYEAYVQAGSHCKGSYTKTTNLETNAKKNNTFQRKQLTALVWLCTCVGVLMLQFRDFRRGYLMNRAMNILIDKRGNVSNSVIEGLMFDVCWGAAKTAFHYISGLKLTVWVEHPRNDDGTTPEPYLSRTNMEQIFRYRIDPHTSVEWTDVAQDNERFYKATALFNPRCAFNAHRHLVTCELIKNNNHACAEKEMWSKTMQEAEAATETQFVNQYKCAYDKEVQRMTDLHIPIDDARCIAAGVDGCHLNNAYKIQYKIADDDAKCMRLHHWRLRFMRQTRAANRAHAFVLSYNHKLSVKFKGPSSQEVKQWKLSKNAMPSRSA
jgi:hypothetical protein